MEITDKMMKAAGKSYNSKEGRPRVEAIRAALEAALSAAEPEPAPSVAVKALKPFATDADIYDGEDIDDGEKSFNDNITVGDLRRARTALAALSEKAQDVDDTEVYYTTVNNWENRFFGPGASTTEIDVIWDFAKQTWANADLKIIITASPASKHGDAE